VAPAPSLVPTGPYRFAPPEYGPKPRGSASRPWLLSNKAFPPRSPQHLPICGNAWVATCLLPETLPTCFLDTCPPTSARRCHRHCFAASVSESGRLAARIVDAAFNESVSWFGFHSTVAGQPGLLSAWNCLSPVADPKLAAYVFEQGPLSACPLVAGYRCRPGLFGFSLRWRAVFGCRREFLSLSVQASSASGRRTSFLCAGWRSFFWSWARKIKLTFLTSNRKSRTQLVSPRSRPASASRSFGQPFVPVNGSSARRKTPALKTGPTLPAHVVGQNLERAMPNMSIPSGGEAANLPTIAAKTSTGPRSIHLNV